MGFLSNTYMDLPCTIKNDRIFDGLAEKPVSPCPETGPVCRRVWISLKNRSQRHLHIGENDKIWRYFQTISSKTCTSARTAVCIQTFASCVTDNVYILWEIVCYPVKNVMPKWAAVKWSDSYAYDVKHGRTEVFFFFHYLPVFISSHFSLYVRYIFRLKF